MCIPEEFILRLNCKKFQTPLGLVSEEKSEKLLRKGAVGSLVYLVNQPKEKKQIEFPEKIK